MKNFWYGFKVFTAIFSAVMFWVCLLVACFCIFQYPIIGGIAAIAAGGFYWFSQSLQKSLLKEDKDGGDDGDDDIGPYYQVKFV